MKPTGFFTLTIDDPEREHTYSAEAPTSRGELDTAGVVGSGYSVRVGWMEGVPYLVDLGSTGQILVNEAPIEPNSRVCIQAGDRITIGTTHLTWNAERAADQPSQEPEGAQAAKVTVVFPRATAELPVPRIPGEQLSPPGKHDEAVAAETPDATVYVPKQTVQQDTQEVPEATVVVPKGPEKVPLPETPDATFLASKRGAEWSVPEIPDATILVPKVAAQPPMPEPPEETAAAPGEVARMPDETGKYGTAWIDMTRLLEEEPSLEFVSTTLLRDTRIPHLVFHLPNRTWEVQLTEESLTIGRGEGNDVSIPDESVSVQHAVIECRGQDHVIRDAGSTNGLWLGKRRIEEHRLRDGDVLRLGRARLVFKGGFTSDDLTLIGTPRIDGRPARRPVVFVPGLMGSELWLGSECLWPNPRLIISNPEVFCLPGDPRIEARGILNDVVIVPNIIESRQYSALGDYLVAGLGYTRGKDLLEFGYDWRHDVRLAAQRLAEAIEGWQVKAPITIIAHSLGTLVTRYYVERLGGKRSVERVILMGGPHYGTPKGMAAILSGPGLLPFGLGDERMRAVLATFPSAYQILPTYPCVVDQNGDCINVLEDESWLPEHQRPFLRAARSFRRELGSTSSVPAVSVFGYGLKTKLRVKIHRRPDGQWRQIEFIEESAGDQSVPSGSAVLKDSEIHPVLQEHGSLYVDDDVRMRLKVELTRSTTWHRSK